MENVSLFQSDVYHISLKYFINVQKPEQFLLLQNRYYQYNKDHINLCRVTSVISSGMVQDDTTGDIELVTSTVSEGFIQRLSLVNKKTGECQTGLWVTGHGQRKM